MLYKKTVATVAIITIVLMLGVGAFVTISGQVAYATRMMDPGPPPDRGPPRAPGGGPPCNDLPEQANPPQCDDRAIPLN